MLSREKHRVLFLSLQIYINNSSPVSTEFAKVNFVIVLARFSLLGSRFYCVTAAMETRPHCMTLFCNKSGCNNNSG